MNWYINRKFSDLIEHSPGFYMKVQRWRFRKKPYKKRLVAPDTDIMIEGYPRCANSFAVRAFLFDNYPATGGDDVRKMKVATHLHSPVHVISAIRMKIPCLVLIRHPDSAVVSLLGLMVQFNQKNLRFSGKEKERLIGYWTKRYASFYKTLAPYADDFVIADFNETTSDFSKIINRVNARFNKCFKLFIHTEENVQAIFASSRPHLHPSREREKIKLMFKDGYFGSDNNLNREKAVEAYQNFLNLNCARK